jgi:hypothetical protein
LDQLSAEPLDKDYNSFLGQKKEFYAMTKETIWEALRNISHAVEIKSFQAVEIKSFQAVESKQAENLEIESLIEFMGGQKQDGKEPFLPDVVMSLNVQLKTMSEESFPKTGILLLN